MSNSFPDDTFLARWLAGTLNAEEQAALEAHPHFEDFKRIAEQVQHVDVPTVNLNARFQAIKEKKTVIRRLETRRKLFFGISIAASIAILVFAWFQWMPSEQVSSHSTIASEQKTIELPDQSKVILNANSTISYSTNWAKNRSLRLEGEAYFEVKKGQTFTVETPKGKVRVLGTTFNIWQRGNLLEVSCFEGQVAIDYPAGSSILNASQAVRIQAGKQIEEPLTVEANKTPTWLQGTTTYTRWSAKRVMEELGRQYAVSIQWETPQNPYISGKFPHNQLELALKIICESANLNCVLDNKTIRISEK